jgi:hypothetical protein
MAALDRPFKAPAGWKNIALLFGLFNIPLCLVGVVYLNSLEVGWTSTWVGFIVLALYLPLWFYSRNEAYKEKDTISAVGLVSSISSSKKK